MSNSHQGWLNTFLLGWSFLISPNYWWVQALIWTGLITRSLNIHNIFYFTGGVNRRCFIPLWWRYFDWLYCRWTGGSYTCFVRGYSTSFKYDCENTTWTSLCCWVTWFCFCYLDFWYCYYFNFASLFSFSFSLCCRCLSKDFSHKYICHSIVST